MSCFLCAKCARCYFLKDSRIEGDRSASKSIIMITQGMQLKDLVRALGWTYATLWSAPDLNTFELVSADGSFEANPLKRYDSEYWNVERIFTSSYKSCAFALGSGYVGKVLKEGRHLWLNGIEDLIYHSNTSSQAHFFKVAGIQTLLCIPWCNSVVELGSSSLVPRDPSLLIQIGSFLSHMATSKQHITNAYFPIEGSFASQDLSAGSDDASFNGGLNCDQQVESCSSFPPRDCLAKYKSISSTQRRTEAAAEHDLREEVVAGSGDGESDWRLEFTSSEMLQKNLTCFPSSPTSTLRRPKLLLQQLQQQGVELVEGADFASTNAWSPPQQMPLLSHLEYNHSNSTSSPSSPRGDYDTNNFPSAANVDSELQSGGDSENSNDSGKATNAAAAGFIPWNNTTSRNSSPKGSQKSSSNSNQVLLRRSITMTYNIPQLKASREKLQGAAEQKTSADVNYSNISTVEEVLSGHDEAAVNHMLAERKRRQKQKENFSSLRSLIPFVSKMDRASILGDAIIFVKQLTARVEELEHLNRELEAQLPHFQHKRSRSSTVKSM